MSEPMDRKVEDMRALAEYALAAILEWHEERGQEPNGGVVVGALGIIIADMMALLPATYVAEALDAFGRSLAKDVDLIRERTH